jgi:hypothetical protein
MSFAPLPDGPGSTILTCFPFFGHHFTRPLAVLINATNDERCVGGDVVDDLNVYIPHPAMY